MNREMWRRVDEEQCVCTFVVDRSFCEWSVFVARGEWLWLCSCRGRAVSGRGELQLGGDATLPIPLYVTSIYFFSCTACIRLYLWCIGTTCERITIVSAVLHLIRIQVQHSNLNSSHSNCFRAVRIHHISKFRTALKLSDKELKRTLT